MNNDTKKGITMALLAAALYAINSPFSKLLLSDIPPVIMAGFLYLGAGLGMLFLLGLRNLKHAPAKELHLPKSSLFYTVAMVLLDIAAPICLLIGLNATTAANASLLNNFEIVSTALIAFFLFHEKISRRLSFGILLVTISCLLLSFEDASSLQFSYGSLFILLACICWGFENNCTKKLSEFDPLQIVLIKGICSGLGSLTIGLIAYKAMPSLPSILLTLLLGFLAYGLSIYVYIYAQRYLGAAKTSAYYAVAPFIGTFLSLLIFQEIPSPTFFIALGIMILGVWTVSK